MKTLRSLLLMSCAALAIANARATTVIPPTFDQLVGDAELIFQGTVTIFVRNGSAKAPNAPW